MANTSASSARTPGKGSQQDCDPLELRLDPQNPRLRPEERGSSQPELRGIMIERFKAEELAESIIAGGFYAFDPIVAYREKDQVTIREGNRRVATIQLLLEPELAPERHQDRWRELSKQCAPHRASIATVGVTVYPSRDDIDITAYIGFRHVTGVLKWPALEKARFIADLVEGGMSYGEIAKRTGSYPRHVERHCVAYRLVQQALDSGIPGASSMENRFGVLLRALQSSDIVGFLGVSYSGEPDQATQPVPQDHWDNFREFVVWTFGTEDHAAVLSDSRDLTKWGTILQSGRALTYLRNADRPDFARAWFRCGGQEASLAESLYAAADRLQESVPLAGEHKESDDVKEAVQLCASFLVQILRHFPDIRQRYGVSADDD